MQHELLYDARKKDSIDVWQKANFITEAADIAFLQFDLVDNLRIKIIFKDSTAKIINNMKQ